MKTIVLSIIAATTLLAGCASTGKVTPQYINPSNYQSYDCNYLQNETNRIAALVEQTKKSQFSLASTGLGIGITGGRGGIYPTISLGMGTGSSDKAAKNNALSRLYGEHDAMVVVARQKSCAFAQGIKIYGE